MLITLIAALIFTSLVSVAAVFAAGFLYGKQTISAAMIVEAKRRERRLNDRADQWANKYLEKTNSAPLYQTAFTEPSSRKLQPKVVSPSEKIAEMKRAATVPKPRTETVPSEIAEQFLADTSHAAVN